MLHPISVWLNHNASVSWRAIEENLASPHRLQDLVYCNLTPKQSRSKLGPIMSFLLSIWHMVEKATHFQFKWHTHSPIFHNYGLLTEGVPFSIPQWSNRGIHILFDVCNEEGLRMFNDLRLSFELPGSSFFLYLQLRSSMRAYGVPWEQPLYTHELHVILDVGAQDFWFSL